MTKKDKQVITAGNLEEYLRHKNGCGYWKVGKDTSHTEALKKCDCGYAQFVPLTFVNELIADCLRLRIARVCSFCKNGAKAYLTAEGYYHSKFGDDQFDDFCDAYELWKWIKELGYINPHEEKTVIKTEAQAFFEGYGLD